MRQALAIHQRPEHAMRRRRSADVAHANKKNINQLFFLK
jgi:hypothetical protein